MELKMFSVYDSKAEAFKEPFYMRTTGEALRAWEATVNDETTQFNKWPGDYTLFEIGSWDSDTGKVKLYDAKTNLGLAQEVLRPKNVSLLNKAQ